MSELALELVRRQRARGREILLRYPLHTSVPLPLGHVKAGLRLVYGTLDDRAADRLKKTTRCWLATTTTVVAGRLSECAQQEANGARFLLEPGRKIGRGHKKSPSCVHVADRTSEPTLTPMGVSFDDTKRPSSSDTTNQDSLETSSRESWTSHQRRSDQMLGRRWRHSRGTEGSEMYSMFHLRKDESLPAVTDHLASRQMENASIFKAVRGLV